jgi:ABC-type lipoprotein release transport system permease subunit
MATVNLIFKEIVHRKINSLLALLAVVIAVALFVAFVTTGRAYRRETRRVMRDMGQNLRIIPKKTTMDEFWSHGFSQHTMPEEYVRRFASLKGYSYTHLTATLQKKVQWKDRTIILTGILPEVLPLDKRFQKPMTFSVKPGDVYIGHQVAQIFDIKKADKIDLFGKSFNVKRVLLASGSNDDIRIYGHLHDIQGVLNLEGKINEIKALECLCLIEQRNDARSMLEIAREQLAEVLPEGKVILLQGIAEIRQKQRAAMEGYLAFIMLFVVIACGAWIAALMTINVRDRQREIGIMRALGYGSGKITALFLGKAVMIGLFAAGIGFLAGTALALNFGPDIFKVTAKAMKAEYGLLSWSLVVAPLFACVCSFIPAMVAVTYDPAVTLRSE